MDPALAASAGVGAAPAHGEYHTKSNTVHII